MKPGATSTAFGPMVIVAIEQRQPADARLIDDPLAVRMLPLSLRAILVATRWRPIENRLFRAAEAQMPGIWAGILCRKRYIDDVTSRAIQDGIETVVVLGAGLDTRAYRLASLADRQIYEVDQPENSHYKRARLKSIYGRVPQHVTLIALDFDTDDLLEKLIASGYEPVRKTLFVWEGVTQYLTRDGVHNTLSALGKAAPGSRLVFTYVRKDFTTGRNLYGAKKGYERFVLGEKLWHFAMDPDEVAPVLAGYGWQENEQVGAAEYDTRYISPTGRRLRAMEIERCVLASRPALPATRHA